MGTTAATAGILKAQFDKLADRYNDLFHCYVMIDPDAAAEREHFQRQHVSGWMIPPEAIALAVDACPIPNSNIVVAEPASGQPSYSVYLAPANAAEPDRALVEFRALAANCISLPLEIPEQWSHAAGAEAQMFFSQDANGNPIPGTMSGFSGNATMRELRWLDHLYASHKPPHQFNSRFTWTALPSSIFRASSWAIDNIGAAITPRLFSLDEVARVVGWKEQTLRNNFPKDKFSYPAPAQQGRPALYRFVDWRPLLSTRINAAIIPATDEEAHEKLETLAKVSIPG